MALPQLSDAERRAALKKAVETRQKRAALKKKIKSGQISFAAALNDPIAAKMKVKSLIESVPKLGKARAAKIMEEIGINPSRRVQGLGKNQKEKLLERIS